MITEQTAGPNLAQYRVSGIRSTGDLDMLCTACDEFVGTRGLAHNDWIPAPATLAELVALAQEHEEGCNPDD